VSPPGRRNKTERSGSEIVRAIVVCSKLDGMGRHQVNCLNLAHDWCRQKKPRNLGNGVFLERDPAESLRGGLHSLGCEEGFGRLGYQHCGLRSSSNAKVLSPFCFLIVAKRSILFAARSSVAAPRPPGRGGWPRQGRL